MGDKPNLTVSNMYDKGGESLRVVWCVELGMMLTDDDGDDEEG